MIDFSFIGILNHIASYTTFGLIYLIGGAFLIGMVGGFYWGMRQAVVVGLIIIAILFLFLSYQETGLTVTIISNFLSFFRGIFYAAVGLVVGAVLAQLMFRAN